MDIEIKATRFRRKLDSKSANIVNKIGHDLFRIKELSNLDSASNSFSMPKKGRSQSFDNRGASVDNEIVNEENSNYFLE